MNSRAVLLSERLYRGLLSAYPASFRERFGVEMRQVFRSCCQQAYRSTGAMGLLWLWLFTLWDLALTAARERISSLFHRSSDMSDTLAFDRQLGDLVWTMTTALRAGYSLRQIFEQLAAVAPEPTASACRRLVDDLGKGLSLSEAFANLRETIHSPHLNEIVDTIQKQRQTGGNLANMLEPLGEEILKQAGSDPAFYDAMRELAESVQARLPERACRI